MCPYDYSIDAERELAETRRWGVVTEDELFVLYHDLRLDPAIKPGLDQLADWSAVERIAASDEALRELGRLLVFTRWRKRAFVVSTDEQVKLMRVFQAYAAKTGQAVEVFRDRAEAERWLGLGRAGTDLSGEARPP